MIRTRLAAYSLFVAGLGIPLSSCASADKSSPGKGKAPQAKSPLRVCMLSGSLEYKSDESLSAYKDYLEKRYDVTCALLRRQAKDKLPGLEALHDCDVAIIFTRRMTIDGEDLERVKRYCTSGKPLIGIRTASHGFQNWLALDKEVFGGNYKNHYGSGPKCKIGILSEAKDHPILSGFKPYESEGSLYRNTGLAKDTTVLLDGSIPGHTEPIAWTRPHKGGRVFYTSLGHPDDFKNESFLRLLTNAIFWVTKREPPMPEVAP
ncbi:MAG: ThuA domain-containing protein [Phycisphaerae bacterium]|nr:ThuA domain-containing protein [Phycisphaerae bacterium]